MPGRLVAETGRFHPQRFHQRNLASLLAARQREQPAQFNTVTTEEPEIQPVTQAVAMKLLPILCLSDFRKHLSRIGNLRVVLCFIKSCKFVSCDGGHACVEVRIYRDSVTKNKVKFKKILVKFKKKNVTCSTW